MAENKTNTNRTTKERKWRWISQTHLKPQGAIERHAFGLESLEYKEEG
jgi:hypothetical protein